MSRIWLLISMAIFIGVELILGGLVGEIILGRYLSLSLSFMLQGLLHLTAFFIGGIVIGVISPELRISEPAAGAFLSVGLMFLMAVFTPYHYIRFSLARWLVGGILAAFIAFVGAEIGERLSGNKVE